MKRVAIIGGGISGLTAAYEFEKARRAGTAIDWHLYEATDRLGGIIETTRLQTPEGEYILEGGPDGWVSEKPWARDLAIEIGLEDELIYSNDATRKTYIVRDGRLEAIPDGMRMMVPTDLSALDESPLFSAKARAAYAAEPARSAELKASAPTQDESVASFVRRHFGDEVLDTLAAPLLSGVFGGDVHKLSVRAVMPQFVTMEREHGSLIVALRESTARRGGKQPQPIFTSLRHGMASLIDAIREALPHMRYSSGIRLEKMYWDDEEWALEFSGADPIRATRYSSVDEVILATSADVTRRLLGMGSPLYEELRASDGRFRKLAPTDASSAILAAMTWPAEIARTFTIPTGFGFLVPPIPSPTPTLSSRPEQDSFTVLRSGETCSSAGSSTDPQLLAATFVDQKFPHRAPEGARILRAFFGGAPAESLAHATDAEIVAASLTQLRVVLGPIPEPAHTTVRRWPRSLPQYEVGHLDRMAELDFQLSRIPGLHLLGNSYRGVGIPDLIRDARSTARRIIS